MSELFSGSWTWTPLPPAKIPGSMHVYILCLGSLMVMELIKVAVGYREEFGKGIGVHPGFVLSTLFSIILLEVLSRVF